MDKDTIETIGYVLLGVIAAYLLNFGLGLALGTELPVVAVVSNSMTHDSTTLETHYEYLQNNFGYNEEEINSWPISDGFYKGDVLVVKGVKENNLEVGDVIVYSIKGQATPIVHRIIDIEDDEIITKGDHNPSYDPWKPNEIYGESIFVIPYLGWPKLILTKILGGIAQ
jgi:signal peptidase